MTESTLPTCICEIASAWVASTRVTPGLGREVRAQLLGLRSTRRRPPSRGSGRDDPPWKMSPNMTMNTSGKASVQKTAARSRV